MELANHMSHGITAVDTGNWNTAFSWGNHATAGYLTTETGDITAVTAGSGLSGGGTSGAVTLYVDTAAIQERVSGTCPSGSSIRVIAADGTVTCEQDNDTIVVGSISATSFTGESDDATLTITCPAGKVMTGFSIDPDDTILGNVDDMQSELYAEVSLILHKITPLFLFPTNHNQRQTLDMRIFHA